MVRRRNNKEKTEQRHGWQGFFFVREYIGGKELNLSNSALQVDLMGQVNAERIGTRQFSGIGGQVDFVRGASRSKNVRSIIALPSTAAGRFMLFYQLINW